MENVWLQTYLELPFPTYYVAVEEKIHVLF